MTRAYSISYSIFMSNIITSQEKYGEISPGNVDYGVPSCLLSDLLLLSSARDLGINDENSHFSRLANGNSMARVKSNATP